MDWTTIITTFFSSGVFISLFLITERKTAAAMKNILLQSSEWQKLYEEEKADNDKKDTKISELISEKDRLRDERDKAISEKHKFLILSAKADVLKCECLDCKTRRPPLDFSKLTIDNAELLTQELRSIREEVEN